MRAMGAINTETLLLVGGAGLALYFFMKPAAAAVPPGYNPATGLPYQQTALQYSQVQQQNQPSALSSIASIASTLGSVAMQIF